MIDFAIILITLGNMIFILNNANRTNENFVVLMINIIAFIVCVSHGLVQYNLIKYENKPTP